MRQLYLVDEIGATFTFGKSTNTYLVDVEGLGVERDNTYLNFDGTYKLAKRDNPKTEISGTIVFLDAYEGYTSFLNYLRKAQGSFRLFYKADTLKYIYVELVSLSKSDIAYGVLQSSVKFDKLSMWLSKVTSTINVNESSANKVFPFKYPFVYSTSYNGEITVTNNGSYKAPVRVEIQGKTSNPAIEIIKNDTVISKMKMMVSTSNANDVIVVNAEVVDQEMSKTVNGVTTNIYQDQDFTCDNFLFLDPGTFKVRFDPGVSEKTTCKFQFLEMYEGN
ncbi:MAG TPA: phage tail family protein [Bacilli bacterium]|jgi:hypothetical protein|nr:phage tail family protein [Bacilli bacterium]